MTDTALIGSSCALGVFWSSKRYFDYLIDETNLSLLRGKEFGQAVIICPSLREGGAAIRRNTAPFLAQVKTLIDILHEVKAERVTYITSIDTQPETGNELSPLLRKPEDEWLMALVELKDFINLRFGRVLNVCLPEGIAFQRERIDVEVSYSRCAKQGDRRRLPPSGRQTRAAHVFWRLP